MCTSYWALTKALITKGYEMKRNVLKIVVCLLLLAAAQVAKASDAGVEQSIPTQKIVSAVKAYANLVGCFIHMDDNNIVRYKINGRPVFVALYAIDATCSGGSAMSRPAFVALGFDIFRKRIFILSEYSNPAATSEKFPQYIDRIFIKDNQLWFAAKDFNWGVVKDPKDGDALCCPSLQVEAQVLFKDGAWLDSRANQ